ncbi:hypothetical protein N7472_005231 [Penicillium cf. griseofulvum]|uniref:Uncharacterized protein n=1 Tax=Penicillium cf. griseofulvum TaxID=2972120 RepID=A0A9W9JP82_9EURO|nr:hypothetical protein N7472_005231 [Penicillium cf. griseofulvum]
MISDKDIIVSQQPGDTSRYPYGSHADSRGPSQIESEKKTAAPGIEQPVPIRKLQRCPASANERISQALATLDFTTLHSEALSANHMTVQHPEPLSETELTQRETVSGSDRNYKRKSSTSFCTYKTPSSTGSEFDFAVPTPPFQSPTTRQPPHRKSSSQHDVPLPLGVMFDPLWNPAMTRKAAVTAYAIDLHREMLRNHGLL